MNTDTAIETATPETDQAAGTADDQTERKAFKKLCAVAKALVIRQGWQHTGPWHYQLLGDWPTRGGQMHIRNRHRSALVELVWHYGDDSAEVQVRSWSIHHWHIADLRTPETSLGFFGETDLNAAIHNAKPHAQETPVGVYFIGSMHRELRGIVHAGRLFWQRQV